MPVAELAIPDLCLVVLIGASGAGKSTFAARHFAETEVISADRARAMISDDENDQTIHGDAFDLVRYWAGKRLANGKLTVIDATNVQADARRPLVQLAREHDVLPVAIVVDTPVEVCRQRNLARPDRNHGPHVVRRHAAQLQRSLRRLKKEGFRHIHHLKGPDETEAATVVRRPRWTDLRRLGGPFDIIGDVHGCHRELRELLAELGYEPGVADRAAGTGAFAHRHPDGRTAVFVGDLVDRGPGVAETLELVMSMVQSGSALCVAGNHEAKLAKALRGRRVELTHGLAESMAQLGARPETFRAEVAEFVEGLRSHYVLDDGRLVVCHAGLPERFHNRSSGRVRSFCLYGETTGETDEFGLPVRYRWADEYRGRAAVVYGHTPVPTAEWINNTICVDTGCVFGGRLTALRWPERELVSVDAGTEYYEPIKPLQAERGDPLLLELKDVTGRRHVETSSMGRLAIGEDQNAAALEVAGRFTVDPRWLVYLPATMAPVAAAGDGPLLERPAEAFSYYAGQGLDEVLCQEKHMGSRAVAIVGRDPELLAARFRFEEPTPGIVMTRSGRRFFDDPDVGLAAVERLRASLDAADAWDRHRTDWFIIDGELLPWSAKAGPLIRRLYAAVGAAGELWAPAAIDALGAAVARGVPGLDDLLASSVERRAAVDAYRRAYRSHVGPGGDRPALDDLSFAPFAILATEGSVSARNDNHWHLAECDRLVDAEPAFIRGTRRLAVDPRDPDAVAAAETWWCELTGAGGEGMVVKPLDPVGRGPKGLIQPGVKCRGFDYLRIVYGPEYPLPANIERLRARGLGRKRSAALREHALGLEALDRFVANEPLWRVHECTYSILALESDPIDPRL